MAATGAFARWLRVLLEGFVSFGVGFGWGGEVA